MDVTALLLDTVDVIQIVSYPFLIGGAVVGFIIALFQTLTQVQEQTLPQVVKIVLAFAIAMASMDSISNVFSELAENTFDAMIQI